MQKLTEFSELSNNNGSDKPEIVIRSCWDHSGFLRTAKMNISIELFSDHRLKYGMGIGKFCVLFINDRCVSLPLKYGKQRQNNELTESETETEMENENNNESIWQFLQRISQSQPKIQESKESAIKI